jgi:segregation and condensation protein B
MDRNEQRRIVEALVLASPEPLSAQRLADLIPYVKPGKAKDLINELNTEYQEQDRAFEIWEVAGGYQIRTRAEFSGYLQKLHRQRPLRLSRAALETLSIVAYKQPATRAEIEDVRGVECGPVLKSLLDRQLVRIAGHRDVPGKPMVYGTTRRFLEVFGLGSLKDLPALRELDELAREQGLLTGDAEGDDALRDEAAEGDGPEIIVPEGALDTSAARPAADGATADTTEPDESAEPVEPDGASAAAGTGESAEAVEIAGADPAGDDARSDAGASGDEDADEDERREPEIVG